MHLIKWLYPGLGLKRWLGLFLVGVALFSVGILIVFRSNLEGVFQSFFHFAAAVIEKEYNKNIFTVTGLFGVLIGVLMAIYAVAQLGKALFGAFSADDDQKLIDRLFARSHLAKGPAVTVVGGGTGLATLLRGLKQITNNCTAVVAATDDGGSSGRLREELGIIPPGDLRNCLTALADTEPLMSKLMQYRFKGDNSLGGHNFGNLFLAAMADIAGDMEEGLNAASTVLKVRGSVVPSTLDEVSLLAHMADGSEYRGETSIVSAGKKIEHIDLLPEDAAATKSAVRAILGADILLLGPGSLYTSVITNLLVKDIKQAVLKSKAVKVYICNVMTQPGETDGYTAYDHVKAIFDHVGEPFLDYVVVNKQEVKKELLDRYATQGAYPVKQDNGRLMCLGVGVVEANLISEDNLVRHQPVQLAKTLLGLVYRLRLSGSKFKIVDYYFARNSLRRIKKIIEGD